MEGTRGRPAAVKVVSQASHLSATPAWRFEHIDQGETPRAHSPSRSSLVGWTGRTKTGAWWRSGPQIRWNFRTQPFNTMTNDLLMGIVDEYENANVDEIILEKPPMHVNNVAWFHPVACGMTDRRDSKRPVGCWMTVTQKSQHWTCQQVWACLRGTFGPSVLAVLRQTCFNEPIRCRLQAKNTV